MCEMNVKESFYDATRTSTENLYYHVFGEWPEHDCLEYAKEFLVACAASEYGGEEICSFYGFGCERVEFETEAQQYIIDNSLGEMRRRLSVLLQLLYSGRNDEETWRGVADEVSAYFDDAPVVRKAFIDMLISIMMELRYENEVLSRDLEDRDASGQNDVADDEDDDYDYEFCEDGCAEDTSEDGYVEDCVYDYECCEFDI